MTTPKELAVQEGVPIALAWIDAASEALRGFLGGLDCGDEDAATPLVDAALAINFSLPATSRRSAYAGVVAWRVLGTFARVRDVILAGDQLFESVTEQEARRVFGLDEKAAVPPAYALFERGVFFTPAFAPHDPATGLGFGPRCRAAMVVHESVHVIDRVSGEPAFHISEWAEPAFSAQTVEESVHNPSAYASFSAQIYERAERWPRDVRYGAGRPAD